MKEKRNKLWRQQQRDRVYVAQLKWIATCYGSSLIDGKWVRHPCWKDFVTPIRGGDFFEK